MNPNTKALVAALSAVGIAAAVASPAMAKPRHVVVAPDGAYGYASPPAGYNGQAQTVYAPGKAAPYAHGNSRSVNPDFQLEQGN